MLASLSAATVALAANTQTLGLEVAPSDLPAKRFKGVAVTVRTHIENASNPTAIPSPIREARLDLDDDVRFDPRGLPRCRKSQIEGKTTSQALAACGEAKVGGGSAKFRVQLLGTVRATLTAYNARPRDGDPTILLHGRAGSPVNRTAVGTAVVEDSPLAGDFGTRVTGALSQRPDTPGALTDAVLTLKRKFEVDGETRHYLSARCHDQNRRLNLRGFFRYGDGSSRTISASQACT